MEKILIKNALLSPSGKEVERVVNLISVRDAYAVEVFQKLSGMAGIARLLVFIQDNLAFCVHPSGAVYPHVAF